MKPRVLLSVLLNVIALAVPAAVVAAVYGFQAEVNPQSLRDLVALVGTALFSFSVGLGAASLLKEGNTPALLTLVEDLLRAEATRSEDRRERSGQTAS